jgi:hypothetical protein
VRIPQKARWDTLRRTCLSTSSGICGSHSALCSVRGAKCRHTIFLAWVGPVRIPKEARRDMLCHTCVLHPAGSVGHLVHCVASSTQNIDALLLMLGWDRYGFHKKGDGTRYTRLVSLHPVCTIFHVVHCVASGMHHFSCFGGTGTDSKKSTPRHVTQNLCFASGGREMSTHYCSCSGGTGMDSKNSTSRHVTPNLCFASGRIYGSRSAFRCVRDAKR